MKNNKNNKNNMDKKINDVPNYTIKTIMSDNLTENEKEIFNKFQQIQNTNVLEGNTYCDSSLKIPWIVSSNSDNTNNNTNNKKSKNIKNINEFMDEMKNTNTKISKKQQKLNNKKFVELFNKL